MDDISSLEKFLLENFGLADRVVTNKIAVYIDGLREWSNRFNLTSITDEREIIIRHVLDSLELVKADIVLENETVIDMGTGAGLPGIVLAILNQNTEYTLVESNKKKINFLNHIKAIIGLKNLVILNARAEELARESDYREKYSCATARALAPFPISLEAGIGLVRNKGNFCFYASAKQKQEILKHDSVLKELGSQIASIHDYSLPESMGEHSIVIVKKLWKTDKKYPRQYSKIKKEPL